ncbi:MAG: amidohydrolase [Erysipelotrichaceae bacterium]|jgi:predicted amidohydrolase YtcJ|nr:amidohydrolase [Erysipelotrichaceae bacterium]
MSTIYRNGNFYVSDSVFQQAIRVSDGIITHVGSNDDAVGWSADTTIDLMGRTVVPGFNDSHMHLYSCALFLQMVDLNNMESIQACIEAGRNYLAAHPDTRVLVGRGWIQDYFSDEQRLLTRHDLDQITTDIPVFYTRACGHMAVVNTRAIELYHLDENFVVEGGSLGFEEDGTCNGILYENAVGALRNQLEGVPSPKEVKASLDAIARVANSLGLTSVSTNDLYLGSPIGDAVEEGYLLYGSDNPTLRINHQVSFSSPEHLASRIASGYNRSDNPAFNRYGPVKLFADGSLGARTALMSNDYADDPGNRGLEVLSVSQLDSFVHTADAAGIQCVCHAIGDEGIRRIVSIYQSILADHENPNRHGVIHVQITDEDLLHRFADYHIPAIVQPIFLQYDLHIVEDRVGPALAKTSYAFNTLRELGAHVSYGSDSPVENFAPIPCIHCAVNREDLHHQPEGGYNPDEKVTVAQAIDAYTLGSAYASFEEDTKGRIAAGYVADLVVLSDDIFSIDPANILDVKVEQTIVNGVSVYQRS